MHANLSQQAYRMYPYLQNHYTPHTRIPPDPLGTLPE